MGHNIPFIGGPKHGEWMYHSKTRDTISVDIHIGEDIDAVNYYLELWNLGYHQVRCYVWEEMRQSVYPKQQRTYLGRIIKHVWNTEKLNTAISRVYFYEEDLLVACDWFEERGNNQAATGVRNMIKKIKECIS